MANELYLGVDGGATKCILRLEDGNGALIAQEHAGPANIRISVEQSWQAILHTLERMLANAGLEKQNVHLKAAIGIAGCEIRSAYDLFVNYPHPFNQLHVTSDAHVACLGAHAGHDGAIVV